jgi:hypothetical protein
MYSLALIIFVVSEKKAFEHFPIGSNVNLCPVVVAILENVNETTTPKSNCIRNAFFSETINQTRSKLHRNVHWIVLYKVLVFCSDIIFKKAAMADFSLTFGPYGKMF